MKQALTLVIQRHCFYIKSNVTAEIYTGKDRTVSFVILNRQGNDYYFLSGMEALRLFISTGDEEVADFHATSDDEIDAFIEDTGFRIVNDEKLLE